MKNEIIVDDNFLSESHQEDVKNFLTNSYFPWYLCEEKTLTSSRHTYDYFKTISQNIFEYLQFVHVFVNDSTVVSSATHIPMMIADSLKEKYNFLGDVLRIKANLSTRAATDSYNLFNTPHIDDLNDHWVVLYYVCDSDGDTYLFNEHISYKHNMTCIKNLTIDSQINPKQGRCVIFDGSRLHAGMHPSMSDCRIVINFNFAKL